jgi:thioester reductase-like protein
MNSRTLSFAEEIMDFTERRGVDIVLNSLAGDAIGKSLAVLAPYGRFLEIGKRDIYENTRIGLRPFRNNLSYFAIDLGGALETGMIGEFLRELRSQFENDRLHPLPYRTYSLGNLKSAFHSMAQGKHIGKVVLNWRGEKVRMHRSNARPLQVRADATYLITGGLGGFGLATAEWLVARGARHVVLTSRTGDINEEARLAIDRCEAAGAKVRVAISDVSSDPDVARLFADIATGMPPLCGVVHAAMVLDDGLLADLDAERLHRVLAPKMSGAWNLHLHTRELPLDFFLLYSSISSAIGNRGQANYAAANSFLDGLAHHRRALQLPALAINWGAIGQVGYVARNEHVQEHLARYGWNPIPLREAFAAIELLLQSDVAQMTVLRVDLEQWLQATAGAMNSPRYSLLTAAAASDGGEAAQDGISVRAALASAAPHARLQILELFLAEQIAKVLRTTPANIERDKSLHEVGLDSLMAVELLNRIENQLGVSLASADVMSGPTVARLSAILAESFGGGPAPEESRESPGCVQAKGPAAAVHAASGWTEGIELSPTPVIPKVFSEPSAIFLTGATGFLGAYLLRELLDRTKADIYCLVRADDPAIGMARIEENLRRYGQNNLAQAARIVPVTGDLEKPLFGLTQTQFDALAQMIDVVHHCGALVRHLSPYAAHEAANVAGTIEVLRFASSAKTKPLHYVSTLAVFSPRDSADSRLILESDEPDDVAGLMGGYAESKWAAEAIVRRAASTGLPIAIYRPGLITGDSTSGISSPDDFIWRLVRNCIDLGAGPDSSLELYLTPVNYVAAAIAHLSLRPQSVGNSFHLVNAASANLSDLLEFARSTGHPIRKMSFLEWESAALNLPNGDCSAGSLRPYLLFYPEAKKDKLRQASAMPRFDCSNAVAGLAGSDIHCPPVNDEMLRRFFDQFIQQGSWPPPPAREIAEPDAVH